MNGLTDDDKSKRYSLLNYNMDAMLKLMKESGYADPVGLIIDATDKVGKDIVQIIFEKTYGEGARDKFVDQCENIGRIPTAMYVVDFDNAKKIMAITSPTALKNLATPRPANVHFIVVIAGGGNTYAGVHLSPDSPGQRVKDGQHKTSTGA